MPAPATALALAHLQGATLLTDVRKAAAGE